MFVHQSYDRPPDQGVAERLRPHIPIEDHDALNRRLDEALSQLSDAGVTDVLLLRGTFVGVDPLGLARKLSRLWPEGAAGLRRISRNVIDHLAGDAGNFDHEDIVEMQRRSDASGLGIRFRSVAWSGENHHAGRADGAIRLTQQAADCFTEHPNARIVIIGHSHGGNVAAIASQLWEGDGAKWQEFLLACRTIYQSPFSRLGGWFARVDQPTWQWALGHNSPPQIPMQRSHVATLGTPVRYGWSDVLRPLHFIHLGAETPLGVFPPSLQSSQHGDIVQQLAIAGTNFRPGLLSYRTRLADKRLERLLESDFRRRDLWRRLKQGVRLHNAGVNLLVDYSHADDDANDVFGHAVYTRTRWLAFHLQEIAARIEAADEGSSTT